MNRFQKKEVSEGRWKIRDTEANNGDGKWVTDANGRQVRHDDEDRIDAKVEELERRTNDSS